MAKQTKTRSKELTIKRVGELIKLHKVGVNWFARCPFCSDTGRHFCITHEVKDYRCFNCPAKGTLDEFFVHFGIVDKNNPNQLSI
jgi:DNA primase